MSIASILTRMRHVAKIVGAVLLAVIISLVAFHLIGWAIKLAVFTIMAYVVYIWLMSRSSSVD